MEYDPKSGRLISVADWMEPPRVVRYGYDERGRLSSVTDREGNVTRYTYHGDGFLLKNIIDANGHTALSMEHEGKYGEAWKNTRYDAWGQITGQGIVVTSERTSEGDTITTHTYPPSGFEPELRTKIVDYYDGSERIVKRVEEPSSRDEPLVEQYTYDAEDNQFKARSGGKMACQIQDRPSKPTFDIPAAPQLNPEATLAALRALATCALATDIVRDSFGRVTAFVLAEALYPGLNKAECTGHIRYDREDRVRYIEIPNPEPEKGPLVMEFRYDMVGNVTEMVEPDGKVKSYKYDERDALAEVRWPNVLVAKYDYDDRGNLKSARIVPATGEKETAWDYAFDGARRLRRVTYYPNWPDRNGAKVEEYCGHEEGERMAELPQR